ncbi:MAG: AAA family ATPase [Acutalibacteraceae bacterium]
MPDPFIVLATQNPVGSAGTTMLPNSQLDRFLIRVSMGYPDHKSSVNILRDRHVDNPLDRAYAVVNKEELLGLVQEARKVGYARRRSGLCDHARGKDPHPSAGRARRQPARCIGGLPDGESVCVSQRP